MNNEQIERLRLILPEITSIEDADLKKHAGNIFYISSFPPDVVCYPTTEDEIIKIVDFCTKENVPLIPYGSGTSVEGHTAALHGGVCLDMKKMNQILEINLDDSYVQVQPGISYNELNVVLSKYGFHFPVEAGWGASIGGMVATNASGPGATDAGSMRKNVRSCDVIVYKQGKAVKVSTATKSPKSSAGYDLTGLFVGSEGTLGVITKITLQIRRDFICHKTICCQFNTITSAVDFVKSMKGIVQFRRVELMDKLQTEACANFSKNTFLEKNKHTVIIELGGNKIAVQEEVDLLTETLKKYDALNVKIYDDKETAIDIWTMRKNACLAAIKHVNSDKKAMATDVCVPISKLSECIQSCYEHMYELGIIAPLVAHVGDGNFHFTILVNPNNKQEIDVASEFNKRVVAEALKFGGTCSGEHGIGMGKMEHLSKQHADTLFLMEGIKTSFDPKNIFNRGKMINPSIKYYCSHGDGLLFSNRSQLEPQSTAALKSGRF